MGRRAFLVVIVAHVVAVLTHLGSFSSINNKFWTSLLGFGLGKKI